MWSPLEAEHAVTRQELAAVKQELAELLGELKTKSALADMESGGKRRHRRRGSRRSRVRSALAGAKSNQC